MIIAKPWKPQSASRKKSDRQNKKMVPGKEYKKSCTRSKKLTLITSVTLAILINNTIEEIKNSTKKKEKKTCETAMKR